MDSLEARISRLEANDAIRQLPGRYAYAIDNRDWDALRKVFTKDAVLKGVPAKGRDDIANAMAGAMAAMGPTMHVLNQQTIEWNEDGTANGVSYGHSENVVGDTLCVTALRYLDKYAFEDGEWKIADRWIQARYITPAEEYVDIFRKDLRVRWPGAEPAAADF